VINKEGEYWHLYFNEYCADRPAEILALVEKLYAEMDAMCSDFGSIWYVRARPLIDRLAPIDDEDVAVLVHCRFSVKAPPPKSDEPKNFGLAKGAM
jgi:hypothetical protein